MTSTAGNSSNSDGAESPDAGGNCWEDGSNFRHNLTTRFRDGKLLLEELDKFTALARQLLIRRQRKREEQEVSKAKEEAAAKMEEQRQQQQQVGQEDEQEDM